MPDRHVLGLYVAQTKEDRRDLERFLKERFPGVRFLNHPSQEVAPGKLPTITYVTSTVDDPAAKDDNSLAWVEPPGWSPAWEQRGRYWSCSNMPPLLLAFQGKTTPFCSTVQRPLALDPLRMIEVPVESYDQGWIGGWWFGEAPEVRSFLGTIVRRIKKVSTNQLCTIDRPSGRPRLPPIKGSIEWVGQGVVDWMRGAPNRFYSDDRRPGNEFLTYHWPLPTDDKHRRRRTTILD